MNKKEIAVCKYMDLRIKGFGFGLTNEELEIINDIPDDEWRAIRLAIVELGGTVPCWKGDNL